MKFGFPAMIVLLPVAIAILYLVFRPELKGTFETNTEQVDWDKGKVVTLAIFGLTVFFWIFSGPINDLLGGFKSFDTIVH